MFHSSGRSRFYGLISVTACLEPLGHELEVRDITEAPRIWKFA